MKTSVAFALVVATLVVLGGCAHKEAPPPAPAATTAPAATPPVPAAAQPLRAHDKAVTALAFTGDGKTLASAGEDGTVALWDVASRKLLQRRNEVGGEVEALALAPAGTQLAVAVVGENGEGYVEVVDLAAGQLGATHGKLEIKNAHALAWSPDGATLAIGNVSSTVTLWQPASGAATRTLEGQGIQTRALAFSPDGKTLAGGGYGNTVKLWDVASGNMRELAGHESEIQSVAFSPDGHLLASGSMDRTIRLWDPQTGTQARAVTGDDSWTSLAFTRDGKILAGACDHEVRLVDPATGSTARAMSDPDRAFAVVAVSADGKLVAGGTSDGSVFLWPL